MSDLRERLEGLVGEARDAGELAGLVEILEGALGEARAAAEGDRAAKNGKALEVPMRFGMVGDSDPMKTVFSLIERVAPSIARTYRRSSLVWTKRFPQCDRSRDAGDMSGP